MKNRATFSIVGIALALICLFALLPLQAQTDKDLIIHNLKYEGVDAADNIMLFSWDTILDEGWWVDLQVKDGGVFTVWTSIYYPITGREGARTWMWFTDLSPSRVGAEKFSFRIKVERTDGAMTQWTYLDES